MDVAVSYPQIDSSPIPDDWEYLAKMDELVPLTGHEHERDFDEALRQVNKEAQLALDDFDQKLLSLLLTKLSDIKRFGRDPYIDHEKGENPATHSLHAVLLAVQQFKTANLFDPANYNENIAAFYQKVCHALLIHDVGEMIIEFSSLADRVADTTLEEDPITERMVYVPILRLAINAVETGDDSKFHEEVDALRGKFKVAAKIRKDELIEDLEKIGNVSLGRTGQEKERYWLGLFDVVELKENMGNRDEDLYLANVVKAIEHMQGTQHFVRFAVKHEDIRYFRVTGRRIEAENGDRSELIALSYAEGVRVCKNMNYVESDVPYIFKHAKSEEQIRLALAIRDSVYDTVIDCLNVMPPLIYRFAKSLPKELEEDLARIEAEDLDSVAKRVRKEEALSEQYQRELVTYKDIRVRTRSAIWP